MVAARETRLAADFLAAATAANLDLHSEAAEEAAKAREEVVVPQAAPM